MALERRDVQKGWLAFRNHLLQAKEWSILKSRKSSKGIRRPTWMNKELLTKIKRRKAA